MSDDKLTNYLEQSDWIEVRRGYGEIELSSLNPDEFVTASGLNDGGFIVWRKR